MKSIYEWMPAALRLSVIPSLPRRIEAWVPQKPNANHNTHHARNQHSTSKPGACAHLYSAHNNKQGACGTARGSENGFSLQGKSL
jgi:hypothetical protein